MNALIEQALANFIVDGKEIPVSFLFYEGHDDAYIVYMQQDMNNSLTGDDDLIGYVSYYDFDVYSKGNYTNIISMLKLKLKEVGFVWQPSRSSIDMYETDTGYYHKTLNFAIFKNAEDEIIQSL